MAIPRNTIGVQRLLAVMAALAGLLMIASAAHAATLSTDFGASETPKLTVGFLHNLSASAPSDELLMLGKTGTASWSAGRVLSAMS
jgi:hypothetical protein